MKMHIIHVTMYEMLCVYVYVYIYTYIPRPSNSKYQENGKNTSSLLSNTLFFKGLGNL